MRLSTSASDFALDFRDGLTSPSDSLVGGFAQTVRSGVGQDEARDRLP